MFTYTQFCYYCCLLSTRSGSRFYCCSRLVWTLRGKQVRIISSSTHLIIVRREETKKEKRERGGVTAEKYEPCRLLFLCAAVSCCAGFYSSSFFLISLPPFFCHRSFLCRVFSTSSFSVCFFVFSYCLFPLTRVFSICVVFPLFLSFLANHQAHFSFSWCTCYCS